MSLNAFSKYGRFAMPMPLGAGKMFLVSSDAALRNRLNDQFVTDEDGVVRVHSTIESALDASSNDVGASRGDFIFVMPGHTETLTAALDLDVAGISVIGLGNGTDRPTLTGNGTIDAVNISANNVRFENFLFAAPETDAQTSCINVAGAEGVTIRGIEGIGSQTAKNVVDMITVAAGSHDLVIEDVLFTNATVAVNSFISLEGASSRVTLRRIRCYGDVVTAGLIDGALITHLFMEDVQIGVVGTTKPAATLDSNPTGLARNCFFAGTHATLATNAALGNALRVDNIKVLEETDNSASAAIIPAVDAD